MTDLPPSRPPVRRRPGLPPIVWNTLTGVTLALTVFSCACTALLFLNPQHPFNPLPPPTRTPFVPPTAQATSGSGEAAPTLPPVWTATPTLAPGESPAAPTATTAAGAATPTAASTPTPADAATATAGTPASETPAVGTATPTATLTPVPPTDTPASGGYGYPSPSPYP